jgi:hypothetical protein
MYLIDSTKTNKYRDAEKTLANLFKQEHFEVIPPHALCTSKGVYHTGSTLRAQLHGCLGLTKTVNCDDLSYLSDCVMGGDFFVDCGSFILMVDVTKNTHNKNMLKKQSKMNSRLKVIVKNNISMKVFNKYTKKWCIKPILAGMIIGYDSEVQAIDFNQVIDSIDKINFEKGRVLTYATKN